MPERSPRGTYLRVADALRDQLRADQTSRLPSEAQLMETFAVSRTTVRRALKVLEAENLIVSHPGRGWTPRDHNHPEQEPLTDRLRARLASGDYSVGDVFISESAICDEYATTRAVARRALGELVGAGFLTVVHGKGRMVRTLPPCEATPS